MTTPSKVDIFILAGGLGKRLEQLSKGIPKPMMKTGNEPFLNLLIKYMAGFGFRNFILGIGYRGGFIEDYYRKNPIKDVSIRFSREDSPLDTGGAVKKAQVLVSSNPFIVLNGDSFCEFNPLKLLEFHKTKNAMLTILLKKNKDIAEYGTVEIDVFYRVRRFNEKDRLSKCCFINAGVYIFNKGIFDSMPLQAKFSLEYDFFPEILQERVFGYITEGAFIDIGTPRRYFQSLKMFEDKYL